MYYQHFRLSGPPFQFTPTPAMLYPSATHREGLAALEWGLREPSGFTLLVGEVGTGKTTLVYSLLAREHQGVRTAYATNPKLSFIDMLRLIVRQLGVEVTDPTKFNLLQAFNSILAGLKANERIALLIDEAQDLSDETLEELRLLSNFETPHYKRLQIVLVGQLELQQRLSARQLQQLNQRIGARALLSPLSPAETREYIAYRLKARGGHATRLFTKRALNEVVCHGRGIPRRINVICHNAMLLAYAARAKRVKAAIVREAVAEYDDLLASHGFGRTFGAMRRAWRTARLVLPLCALVLLGGALFYLWSAGAIGGAHAALSAHRYLASAASHSDAVRTHRDVRQARVPAALPLQTVKRSESDGMQMASGETGAPSTFAAASAAAIAVFSALASRTTKPASQPTEAAVPAKQGFERREVKTRRKVVIKPGDSLAKITVRYFGAERSSGLAQVIKANPQIRNANLIFPGDTVFLPGDNELAKREALR